MRILMSLMILLWDHLSLLKLLCSFLTTRTKVGWHFLFLLYRPDSILLRRVRSGRVCGRFMRLQERRRQELQHYYAEGLSKFSV
jgi:hypothetical protein